MTDSGGHLDDDLVCLLLSDLGGLGGGSHAALKGDFHADRCPFLHSESRSDGLCHPVEFSVDVRVLP